MFLVPWFGCGGGLFFGLGCFSVCVGMGKAVFLLGGYVGWVGWGWGGLLGFCFWGYGAVVLRVGFSALLLALFVPSLL